MDKNIKKTFLFLMAIFFTCVMSYSFVSAQEIYGCPNQEIVMFKKGICPDKTPAEKVEEGRIFFGDPPELYFSNMDITSYSLDGKSVESVVVIFNPPACSKKTFQRSNCSGKSNLRGNIVKLRYFSGEEKSYEGLLSSKPLPENIVSRFTIRNFDLSQRDKLLEKQLGQAYEHFKRDMAASGISNPSEIKKIWDSMSLESKIGKNK